MEKPLDITFRHKDPSPAVEARIREKVDELERYYDRIVGCRVVVEQDHRHHQKGNLFRIRLDITLPGKTIVIDRKGTKNQAHQDVYVTVRDAFAAAKRKIEDHARIRRIELVDGREIYFHRNSVVGGEFGGLEVGSDVRLSVDEKGGDKGPQATTVQAIGKHHLPPTC